MSGPRSRGDGPAEGARPSEEGGTSGRASVGVISLPGGMVDPRAYAPLARLLAEAGHPGAIVELPFRLARSEEGEAEVAARAARTRDQMEARLWVLAGHSRGAAIATRLAHRSAEAWDGHAVWRWIEGANHAQFGYYGRQLGDCRATIEREAQQERLVAELLELLGRVESGPPT